MEDPIVRLAVLVDDNEVDLFLQKRFIEISQFAREIREFNSPGAALEFLSSLDSHSFPEIIFLDLNMPLMSGFEFLTRFEVLPVEITGKARIVVVTSSGHTKDRNRAYQYKSVLSFITKPFNTRHLEELREKLGGREVEA